MTVRDLIQKLLLEMPSLDARVYIGKNVDDLDVDSYEIVSVSNEGTNDGVFIKLKDWAG